MASTIPELYREYRKRLEDVDRIEKELLHTNEQSSWNAALLRKSELVREYYGMTEKELNSLINPYLYGAEPLDDEKAAELFEGASEYYESAMYDDVMESQIFKLLWEYYQSRGDEYMERACRCAFSNNAFLNVEGKLRKYAMEQAELVSEYIDRIDYLRKLHKDDDQAFYTDVRRVFETLHGQYEMERSRFEPNVNRMINCFNNLSKIRKYRKYFPDDVWETLERPLNDVGTDVMFMAALHWESVDAQLKEIIGPAFPIGFIDQTKLPVEQRDMKVYVGYIVYAFYSGLLKPEQTFTLLRSYSRTITKEYDFNDPNWYEQPDDSRFAVITTTTKPMFEMIDHFSCDDDKKKRMKAELLYEVKTYIETIPRECACKEYLDQALYHLLYDLIGYIDILEVAIEFIDSMVISRQMATLIHTVMTGELANTILDRLIDVHPELFTTVLDTEDLREVAARKGELMTLMYNAARCHDIGKILIANIINTQIRRLSDMEYSYIKYHPKWSYEILMRNPILQNYAEIALGHHRSYDGNSGYPKFFDNRASRYRILIDLLTVCDCMDAATDVFGRNYAKGKNFATVLAEFKKAAGTHYNPKIINFIEQDAEIHRKLEEMTSQTGRADLYYHIYRKYR
ncbi:MAG: HD domain-containing protein [Lachnospiraceae bacterium]|nr:HD domain-containing protein [Lachnospiraceae bacterium]